MCIVNHPVAVRELGISMKSLADRFGLTEPAIGYAVRIGHKIAHERGYSLLDDSYLGMSPNMPRRDRKTCNVTSKHLRETLMKG